LRATLVMIISRNLTLISEKNRYHEAIGKSLSTSLSQRYGFG
jgi:hypothetical protein